jgi:peptidoglycan lytic transglycosylase G
VSDFGLGTTDGRKDHSPKRGRGCLAVLVALAVLAAGIGFAGARVLSFAREHLASSPPAADYSGTGHGSVVVQVHPGDTAADIAATLVAKGVVASVQAFSDAATNNARSRSIQVGFYRLHRKMSAESALQALLNPASRVGNMLTIPEGLRLSEVVATLAAHTKFSVKSLDRALGHTAALGLPASAHGNPEGYLFPATYDVQPDTTPTGLLKAMVARFEQAASDAHLAQGAAALHLSQAQVVTVASLVQAEVRRTQDMTKVARVIYNRLRHGMLLQLDSTVHYAVDSRGKIFTSRAERRVNSPYNTYLHTGLPPGPIDSPGETALKAALHPAAGSWLYYVTVNPVTGETRFASTLRAQNHNARLLAHWCRAHPGHC